MLNKKKSTTQMKTSMNGVLKFRTRYCELLHFFWDQLSTPLGESYKRHSGSAFHYARPLYIDLDASE